jgi:uncharacterized protein
MAVIVAVLVISACGGKSTPPASSGSTTAPAPTSPTAAPMTFDCATPANKAQQLVCGDAQLSDFDRRLRTAYQQALARPGADRSTLTTAQSAFTTIRDGCADRKVGSAADPGF